ncbi:MAG: TRAP transporter substrate-binding protein DctP [Proteobacteria bacterium]|nr:TRAP transporter substrate-binding protein DctP [Pseudomonadota bacterium]
MGRLQHDLRQCLVAAAALLGGIATVASTAHGDEITLRFATISVANTSTFTEGLVPYARAIERDSRGRIKVDLRAQGEFGKPNELLGLLEKGQIEMASTVQGYYPGRFPRSAVMELPLLYPDGVAGTRAMWKLYEEGLLAEDYAGLKVLGLYVLPPYALFTADQNITSVRDFRGLRMRAASPTVGRAFAQLGVIPVGTPNNMIADVITSGIIDSIAYGWDSGLTTPTVKDKFIVDHFKYLVDLNFAAPALMIAMNKAAYDALPADLKAAIDNNSGEKLSVALAVLRDRYEKEAKAQLRNSKQHTFIAPTPELQQAVARAVAPAVNEFAVALRQQGIDAAPLIARARSLVQAQVAAAR